MERFLPEGRVQGRVGEGPVVGSIFNRSPHFLLISGCLVRPGVLFNV